MQRRSGLIAKKIGMSRVLLEDGKQVPVTLLQMEDCRVVGHKTKDRDGYSALCLGVGEKKPKNTPKAERELYAKRKVQAPAMAREFPITPDAFVDVGSFLSVDHFIAGQTVDATAVSIGRGFAGVMKRHNFGGLRASHGVSISHRSHGSTGQCQDPGRVFKGKKMAGQLGNKQVTVHNLEVHAVLPEKDLILVKGAVPGSAGSYICLRDAVKKVHKDLPFPTGALKEMKTTLSSETKDAKSVAKKSQKVELPAASTPDQKGEDK